MADELRSNVLFPCFVTSSSLTPRIIDEFLETCKNAWPDSDESETDPYCFSLLYKRDDAKKEVQRVSNAGPITGTHPPASSVKQLDFAGLSIDALAQYVVQHFDMSEHDDDNDDDDSVEPGIISSDWFIILDERTTQDKTVLIVNIPTEFSTPPGSSPPKGPVKRIRDWTKRESYHDAQIWDENYDKELKTARVQWHVARNVDILQQGLGPPFHIKLKSAIDDGITQS